MKFRTSLMAATAALCLLSSLTHASTPGARLSDGRVIQLKDFDVSVVAPEGWEVLENHRGKTLVTQPVVKPEPIKDYSKPLYTRNLTVAISHQPRPMDELTAQELRAKLEKDFGQAGGVSGFQILEHRFLDHRAKADALLLYTSFTYNGFPMSQMHMFVSGAKNSALLTYTDLADDFQSNEDAMTLAWNAMMSIQLQGQAPERYARVIQAGVGLGAVLIAGLILLLLRRRAARRLYADAEDRIYQDAGTDESDLVSLAIRQKSVPESDEAYAAHQLRSDVWDLKTQVAHRQKTRRKRPPTTAVSSL